MVLAKLGRARMFAGVPAVDVLLEAAAALPLGPRAHLIDSAAWSATWTDPSALERVARRIEELPPEAGEGRLRARAALLSMRAYAGLRPGIPTPQLVAEALQLDGVTPAERELLGAAAFTAVSEAAMAGEDAMVLVRRAWREPGETLAPAVILAGQTAALLGAAKEALPVVEAAAAGCRRRGNFAGLSGHIGSRGLLLWRLGDLRAAEAGVRVHWRAELGAPPARGLMGSLTLYHLLWVLALRGLADEGRALLARYAPLARESPTEEAVLGFGAGMIAAEAGDVDTAAQLLPARRGSAAGPGTPGRSRAAQRRAAHTPPDAPRRRRPPRRRGPRRGAARRPRRRRQP